LLQFVWKPPKPEELPKTPEELTTKRDDVVKKMTEAEKNNPAVTMPKAEEIQAVSLKKTEEVDSKLNAVSPGSVPGTPGMGQPPGGIQPGGVPGTPNPGGARPPGT
jgi:hypothetical protein